MAWNAWLCDTRTGAGRVRVNPATFSWGRALNSGGSGQATFRLGDPKARLNISRASTLPLAKTLVLDWGGKVVYAGIIWARPYSKDAQTLTLSHKDVWSILPYRHVVESNSDDVGSKTIVIPPKGQPTLSLASIARTVVFEGQDAASEMYRLPIDFAAPVLGGHRRTYAGYELHTVQDALQKLMDAAGGPDVDFRPYWTADGLLRYEMRAGSLTSGTWEWNVAAGKSSASGITLDDDASKIAVNTFAIGQGQEDDMKIRAGRNDASPYPVLERRITHKDEKDLAVLESLAAEHLRVYAEPTQQWGISMLARGERNESGKLSGATVSDLLLGGTVRLYHRGDPWIPDGWHESRLIGFSGDLGESVQLEMQPTGGV